MTLIYLPGAVFAGILCNDRFSAYFKYQVKGLAQLCWAHLKRDLLGIQDSPPCAQERKDVCDGYGKQVGRRSKDDGERA